MNEPGVELPTVRHSSIRNMGERTAGGSVVLEEEVIHRPGVHKSYRSTEAPVISHFRLHSSWLHLLFASSPP